jgi:hypothetical protein
MGGKEYLDYDPTVGRDEIEDILEAIQKNHPEQFAKIAAHIVAEYRLHHDDEDEDGDEDEDEDEDEEGGEDDLPDVRELADMAHREDILEGAFARAVSDGLRIGAENEMYEALQKWMAEPPVADESIIEQVTVVDDHLDGGCYVRVPIKQALDLAEHPSEEEGLKYCLRIRDMEQPHYGWGGYDLDAAVETFMQDDDVPV